MSGWRNFTSAAQRSRWAPTCWVGVAQERWGGARSSHQRSWGDGCILHRRAHGMADSAHTDRRQRAHGMADSAHTRPHHTAGVPNTEVLAAGLVHVSLSPPPAQRPSSHLRRGRGGGRLTPARQGGWTERTWRQTWGLERNEIYPHPAVLAPTVPSSAPLGAWLGQGRGRGRWTGLGKEEVGPPFPSLHPLPPSSRQPHPSPQGPALQTPSPPCCTPQHTLLSWESLTPSAK